MVDSLVAFELEKIKSVEPTAPKIDSVAFAKAIADSVAKVVVQKESAFLAIMREHVTKSTLNVRKKPKAPERQGIQASYEDDLWEQSLWDYMDYPYPLYGCVKSVGSEDWNSIVYMEFNTRGNLSRESVPMSDSSDPSHVWYAYNANNVLIGKYLSYPARPDLNFAGRDVPVELAKKFDSRGNVVLWANYNGWTGDKQGTVKCKYNAKGKIIEKSEYDAESNKTEKTTWKYNSKGKVIEEARYNGADFLDSKYVCKYDKKGNRVEILSYDSNSLNSKKLLHYSANGILAFTEKYNSENNLDEITLYSYDKRGNMVEKRKLSAIGELLSKESFKYDRMSNVIEVRVSPSSWGRVEDVYKYKITYYK